jgi:hypothetical protein
MIGDEVCRFVAREAGGKTVKPSTSISNLLGYEGDDAADFLISFSSSFAVNMSAFPFRSYFHAEGEFTPGLFGVFAIVALFWRHFRPRPQPASSKKALFVWQLIRAAEFGRWTSECE